MNNNYSIDLAYLVKILKQQQIIAYPTEAIFGLGCDPDSEIAVQTLLRLKKRSWRKGLILVAAHYKQLTNYIDDNRLDCVQRSRILNRCLDPITWIVPAKKNTPLWLTGQFNNSIAVRINHFKPVKHLCLKFGKAIVSTSANLSGYTPARSAIEVCNQFRGESFIVMNESIEGRSNPSEIRDVLSGKLIRVG